MILADIVYYIVAILLLVGCLFALLAAIGIVRLPDLYTRMHAASKAGAVAAGMALLAAGLASLDVAVALRAILGILFILLTTPISAHLLARAAVMAGIRPGSETQVNDLDAKEPRQD